MQLCISFWVEVISGLGSCCISKLRPYKEHGTFFPRCGHLKTVCLAWSNCLSSVSIQYRMLDACKRLFQLGEMSWWFSLLCPLCSDYVLYSSSVLDTCFLGLCYWNEILRHCHFPFAINAVIFQASDTSCARTVKVNAVILCVYSWGRLLWEKHC